MTADSGKPNPHEKKSGLLITLIIGGIVAIVVCGGLIVAVLGLFWVRVDNQATPDVMISPVVEEAAPVVPMEPNESVDGNGPPSDSPGGNGDAR